MPQIHIYSKTSPTALHDALMEDVTLGDPQELHNALIVVCNLLAEQAKEIATLKERIKAVIP